MSKRPKTSAEKAPTMADVALKLGVTKMTVSYAFNGSSQISASTREMVLSAAREMGYRPHALAQSLSRRRTDTLGFYFALEKGRILDFRNEFVGEVLYGMQQACMEHGKHLLLHGSHSTDDARQIADEIANGRVDGVLVFAPSNDPVVERIVDLRLPAVAVADPMTALPSVLVDEQQSAELIVQHLQAKGHQKVFYFYSWPAESHSAVMRRKSAFVAQARKAGMEVEAISDCSGAPIRSPEQLVDTIRGCAGRFTAGLGWTDNTSELLWKACNLTGLRVPDDLAIIGFDGCHGRRQPKYNLTTIRAGWDDVATCAIRLLVKQIEGEDVPKETVLPVELILGDST